MKPAVEEGGGGGGGGVVQKAIINYINNHEDSPCFLFNHCVYFDRQQFMKISH